MKIVKSGCDHIFGDWTNKELSRFFCKFKKPLPRNDMGILEFQEFGVHTRNEIPTEKCEIIFPIYTSIRNCEKCGTHETKEVNGINNEEIMTFKKGMVSIYDSGIIFYKNMNNNKWAHGR